MNLQDVFAAKLDRKKRKRIGRGRGSGHGKTSCRGQKGQYSRKGSNVHPGFEGGQTTIIRRMPKRGFNNTRFKKAIEIVNIDVLKTLKEDEITPQILIDRGIIRKNSDGIKILGKGNLDRALTVHANFFSKKAQSEIEKAGGRTVVLKQ